MRSPADICEQWERNLSFGSADVRGVGTRDEPLRTSAWEATRAPDKTAIIVEDRARRFHCGDFAAFTGSILDITEHFLKETSIENPTNIWHGWRVHDVRPKNLCGQPSLLRNYY